MREWLLVGVIWLGCLHGSAQIPFFQKAGLAEPAGTWSHLVFSPGTRLLLPSMLAEDAGFRVRVQTARPYFIKDLSMVRADAIVPISPASGFAVMAGRYGNEYFRETAAALAAGRKLGRRIGAGLVFGLGNSRQMYFGRHSVFRAGGSIHWSKNGTGAGLFFHSELGPGRGLVAGGGLGRDWSDSFYADINFYYQSQLGLATWVSVNYHFLTHAILVLKVETKPLRYSFETGYTLKAYSLLVTGGWHPDLGLSSGFGIQFRKPSGKQADE